MSENRLIETITYPSLSMKKVEIATSRVVDSGKTQLSINSRYMIHFSLSTNLAHFDSAYRIILRFRQANQNNDDVYLARSTEGYLNTPDVYLFNYVVEGSTVYREVDITSYFVKENTAKYFAILCDTDLLLYTSTASSGYKPELRIEKISEDDLLLHQAELEGSISNDLYKVNLRSGKLYYDKHLLSVQSQNSVMNLSMSYSVANRNLKTIKTGYNTGLGRGFKFNYQQLLYANGNEYIYVDGQYKLHTFKLADNLSVNDETKVYYEASGTYVILEQLSNGFKMINQNQELEFDVSGKLIKNSIRKSSSCTIVEQIEYDSLNRITKITSGNEYINISYTSTCVTITGSNSQTVSIFISNSNIDSITNTNGVETLYEYKREDSAPISTFALSLATYILESVSEGNKKIKFSYYNTYKIESVKSYYNNNLLTTEKVEYSGAETKVLNFKHHNGNTTELQKIDMRYQYNDKGEIENVFEVVEEGNEEYLCGVKHYKYDFDETEIMSFNSGAELHCDNVMLNINQSKNSDIVYIPNSGEFILSLACEITQKSSYSILEDYSVYADIYLKDNDDDDISDGIKVETVSFNLRKNHDQFAFVKLNVDSYKNLEIVFHNTSLAHEARFKAIVVTPYRPNREVACVNVPIGEQILTSDNITLYRNNISGFQYIASNGVTNYVSNIKMTTKDILETQRTLLSDKYFIWYNGGQGMVYDIETAQTAYEKENQILEYVNLKDIVNATLTPVIVKEKEGDSVTGFMLSCLNFDYEQKILNILTYGGYIGYPQLTTFSLTKYNVYNQIVSEEKNGTKIKEYTYDTRANNTKISVCANNQTIEEIYTYDDMGRIKSVKNDNGTYLYNYNTLGNLINIKDSSYRTIKNIVYKPDLETVEKVGATINGVLSDITFEYDAYLNEIGHNSQLCSFDYIYDSFGRISSIKKDNTIILSYTYLVENEFTTVFETNQQGDVRKLVYNKYGHLIKEYRNDVLVLEQFFLDYGCLSHAAKLFSKRVLLNNTMCNYTYEYDIYGNLLNVRDNYQNTIYEINNKVEFDDVIDRVMEVKETVRSYTDKAIKESLQICTLDNMEKQYNYFTYYDYDGLNSNIPVPLDEYELKCIEQINTDDFGRTSNKITAFGNNFLKKNYQYKTTTTVTSNLISSEKLSIVLDNTIPQEVDQTAYEYTNGQITKITKADNIINYSYDALGRLIGEVNPKLNINRTYSYDSEGNIYSSDKSYEYIGQRLVKYNGQALTYQNGFLSNYKGMQIEFAFNHLMRYNNTVFTYDGLGRRLSKTTSTKSHNYYYDYSDRLIKETLENGKNIEYIYGMNGIVGFIYDNQTYYYSKNILGDIEAIYNSDCLLVASYEYDAWGNHKVYDSNDSINVVDTFVGNINPFRYRGYYYDVETGLFMVGHRYYNPEWGRWLSPDDIEYLDPQSINGLNLYAYCNNDPVNKYDPTGHSAIGVLLIIGGILISGAITGLGAMANKEDHESNLGAFVGGFIDGAVGAIAVAAGLATGGAVGLLMTAGIAFAGGFTGNAVGQAISYGNVQWDLSFMQGGISMLTNSFIFGGLSMAGITQGITWASRFADALKISEVAVGITSFFTTYSLPSVNKLRRNY